MRKSTFILLSIKEKNADLGGKQIPLRPFLPSQTASVPSFDKKSYVTNPSEKDIKMVFPALKQKILT